MWIRDRALPPCLPLLKCGGLVVVGFKFEKSLDLVADVLSVVLSSLVIGVARVKTKVFVSKCHMSVVPFLVSLGIIAYT
jgi:hypothetical protein